MRVVIDTNIFISAICFDSINPSACLDYVVRHGSLIFSEDTFQELLDKIVSDKFSRFQNLEDREAALESLARECVTVQPSFSINACRDPKDNMILEAAMSGKVDCIITGDNDLLVLSPFQGIDILTPVQFLSRHS